MLIGFILSIYIYFYRVYRAKYDDFQCCHSINKHERTFLPLLPLPSHHNDDRPQLLQFKDRKFVIRQVAAVTPHGPFIVVVVACTKCTYGLHTRLYVYRLLSLYYIFLFIHKHTHAKYTYIHTKCVYGNTEQKN